MLLSDTLNRWRYAIFDWIDVTLVRWQHTRDYTRERELHETNRERWIAVAESNWKRWGPWSSSPLMNYIDRIGYLDKGEHER